MVTTLTFGNVGRLDPANKTWKVIVKELRAVGWMDGPHARRFPQKVYSEQPVLHQGDCEKRFRQDIGGVSLDSGLPDAIPWGLKQR
jgi:hypothetical protein